ncbi:MAG: isoprenylcysteine carboxylmethyltransferase family protein [Candidatus Edwardsbacteria bacterium]
MLEYIIWTLLCLFCLNRLIAWVTIFKKWKWNKWYGTIVVSITGVTLICLPLAPQPRLGLDIFSLLWRIVGIIVFIIGIFVLKLADQEFHKTGIQPDTITTKLVTTGVYSIVRHPQYLGLNISFVGWSLIWGAIYCFYLIPVIIFLNWLQAFLEEKCILVKEFGDEYKEYKKKVGMFLPKIMRG